MIKDTVTKKGTAAVTSDQWHVVLAHFTVDAKSELPFVRSIVSEHDDSKGCKLAAKELTASLEAGGKKIPAKKRDQVFARPPHFKSLKLARRHKAG